MPAEPAAATIACGATAVEWARAAPGSAGPGPTLGPPTRFACERLRIMPSYFAVSMVELVNGSGGAGHIRRLRQPIDEFRSESPFGIDRAIFYDPAWEACAWRSV